MYMYLIVHSVSEKTHAAYSCAHATVMQADRSDCQQNRHELHHPHCPKEHSVCTFMREERKQGQYMYCIYMYMYMLHHPQGQHSHTCTHIHEEGHDHYHKHHIQCTCTCRPCIGICVLVHVNTIYQNTGNTKGGCDLSRGHSHYGIAFTCGHMSHSPLKGDTVMTFGS